jgi:hypothetical protein
MKFMFHIRVLHLSIYVPYRPIWGLSVGEKNSPKYPIGAQTTSFFDIWRHYEIYVPYQGPTSVHLCPISAHLGVICGKKIPQNFP